MSNLTLDTANLAQLQNIARLSGLEADGLKEGVLRQLIKDTMGDDMDLSALDLQDKTAPRRGRKANIKSIKSDTVRLILTEGAGAGGDRPVPVGVNGKIMLIPRGEEVEIPRVYFNVLKDAMSRITHQEGEAGAIKSRDVASYPFQILAG